MVCASQSLVQLPIPWHCNPRLTDFRHLAARMTLPVRRKAQHGFRSSTAEEWGLLAAGFGFDNPIVVWLERCSHGVADGAD